jgi:tRNA(fMet)-specific endonuclease VapC
MDGYLFDTNAVSPLWNARHPEHDNVKAFLSGVSHSPVWLSTIVLAEIEYGLKTTPKMDTGSQNQVRREMAKFPLVLDIDKHTVGPYSDLRAELFKNYSPRDRRGRLTVKWPEDLFERTSAKELGVQENDIWIAAQAIQYDLILVTGDSMQRLVEVSENLDYPLRIARWK